MSVLGTGRGIVETVREEDVPFMAASIAYYAVASFVPLLVLALALVSSVGAREALIETFRSVLSASGSEVLNSVLSDMGRHGVAGVLGAILTL